LVQLKYNQINSVSTSSSQQQQQNKGIDIYTKFKNHMKKKEKKLEVELEIESLKDASLIIIDRYEDLFTPSSMSGDISIAHRVYNTLHCCQYNTDYNSYFSGVRNINNNNNDKIYKNNNSGSTNSSDYILKSDQKNCDLENEKIKKTSSKQIEQQQKHICCDVVIKPLDFTPYSSLHESNYYSFELQLKKMLQPMSAVSNLPFKTNTSICYKKTEEVFYNKVLSDEKNYNTQKTESSSTLDTNLMHDYFASSEEDFKNNICKEFLKRIKIENGVEPVSKKRGFGAEILALTMSLMEARGLTFSEEYNEIFLHKQLKEDENKNVLNKLYGNLSKLQKSDELEFLNDVRYNPHVCLRSNSLLALSFTVIETMQRSSTKQFIQLCEFQNSFETKVQFEHMIINNIQKNNADFDVAIAFLTTLLIKIKKNKKKNNNNGNDSNNNSPKKISGEIGIKKNSIFKKPEKNKNKTELFDLNSIQNADLVFFIMQIIRFVLFM
jgi:hypothetical protein